MTLRPTLYMATLTPGLEKVLESEVLQCVPDAWIHGILRGRVLFGSVAEFNDVLQLKCADNVYIHIAWFRVGATRPDLRVLHDTILTVDTASSLSHLELQPGPYVFVNASRSGKQTYSRFEAAEVVMDALQAKYGFRRGTADDHELEFRLDILDDNALFALRVTPPSFRFRGADRDFGTAALRPSLAHALVWLSQPAEHDVFLDPFCGSGTIAAERASLPVQKIIAGDIDPGKVSLARKNTPEQVEVLRLNACQLPFDAHSIDVIVTNPPWGGQVGVDIDLRALYIDFARESKRVMTKTGKLILLSDLDSIVLEAAQRSKLTCVTLGTISLHGRVPSVYELHA